ncbi:MAG: glycosyltransferase family 4 protein [Burkholderiaceae bacterium]
MRRILFVTRYYASDIDTKIGGVFQRMRMLLEAASKVSDALDVLFFVDQWVIDEIGPERSQQSLATHWGIEADVHLAPRAEKTHGRWANHLLSKVSIRYQEAYFKLGTAAQANAVMGRVRSDTDLIVGHRLDGTTPVVAAHPRNVPVVMDLDDIEHINLLRQLRRLPRSLGNLMRYGELPALFFHEIALTRACTISFVCSENDRRYLAARGGGRVEVIPNSIRYFDEAPPDNARGTLFFIGTYGYPPNVDAAEFLIHDIFPRVLAKRPNARLLIAGEAIEKLPSYRNPPPSVECVGFLPDLHDGYRAAAVVCCPILAGGGTRIKIIEAAAHRKAVVSTVLGAEGLDFEDGLEIVLRDGAQKFADACVSLLDDPQRAAAIGEAAYRKAKLRYDRAVVVERIAENFRRAAKAADISTDSPSS